MYDPYLPTPYDEQRAEEHAERAEAELNRAKAIAKQALANFAKVPADSANASPQAAPHAIEARDDDTASAPLRSPEPSIASQSRATQNHEPCADELPEPTLALPANTRRRTTHTLSFEVRVMGSIDIWLLAPVWASISLQERYTLLMGWETWLLECFGLTLCIRTRDSLRSRRAATKSGGLGCVLHSLRVTGRRKRGHSRTRGHVQ